MLQTNQKVKITLIGRIQEVYVSKAEQQTGVEVLFKLISNSGIPTNFLKCLKQAMFK